MPASHQPASHTQLRAFLKQQIDGVGGITSVYDDLRVNYDQLRQQQHFDDPHSLNVFSLPVTASPIVILFKPRCR